MRRFQNIAALLALLTICVLPAHSQTTPDYDRMKNMSREERIKAHQERIEKIIKETRERQQKEAEEQKQKKAEQDKEAATPNPTPLTGVPTQTQKPGTALPTGPVQPIAAQPGQDRKGPPPPQAAPAPQAARSSSRALLYLKPFDTVVNTGEVFTTEIVADSREGSVDYLSLRLDYPPSLLNPLAIDVSPLASLVDEDVQYDTDSAEGFVAISAPLTGPTKLKTQVLAVVYWEALQPTETGEIRFGFGEKPETALLLSGKSVLGTEGGADDGVIHSNVIVRSIQNKPIAQRAGNKGLLVASSRLTPPASGLDLALNPEKKSARAGEKFTVDVILSNPNLLPFNHLMLYVQFDPSVLEVVDTDRGNWSRDGVNILDAFAHVEFPFDFHRRNDADNQTGEIVYDVARELDPIRANGTVARITFRALKTSPRTDIVLVRNEPGIAPTSDIQYLQQSVLKDRPTEAAPLDGVAMQILPGNRATAQADSKERNETDTNGFQDESDSSSEPRGIVLQEGTIRRNR